MFSNNPVISNNRKFNIKTSTHKMVYTLLFSISAVIFISTSAKKIANGELGTPAESIMLGMGITLLAFSAAQNMFRHTKAVINDCSKPAVDVEQTENQESNRSLLARGSTYDFVNAGLLAMTAGLFIGKGSIPVAVKPTVSNVSGLVGSCLFSASTLISIFGALMITRKQENQPDQGNVKVFGVDKSVYQFAGNATGLAAGISNIVGNLTSDEIDSIGLTSTTFWVVAAFYATFVAMTELPVVQNNSLKLFDLIKSCSQRDVKPKVVSQVVPQIVPRATIDRV